MNPPLLSQRTLRCVAARGAAWSSEELRCGALRCDAVTSSTVAGATEADK